MEVLNDIENYLVIENGNIKQQSFQQDIELNDNHLIIKEDAKVQIIYLFSHQENHTFKITVNKNLNVDLI